MRSISAHLLRNYGMKFQPVFLTWFGTYKLTENAEETFITHLHSEYKKNIPLDTGRQLNVHKTFRRRPGRILNVLCTFN